MRLIEKVWNDPVGGAVIAALIGAAILATVAAVKGYLTLAVIQHVWALTYDFMTGKLVESRWVVIVIPLSCAAFGALGMRYYMNIELREAITAQQRAASKVAQSQSYLEDVMFGFRWRWKIATNSGTVRDLKAFCKMCYYEIQEGAFDYDYRGTSLICKCENCLHTVSVTSDPVQLANKAKLEAERRLRTGEWAQPRQPRIYAKSPVVSFKAACPEEGEPSRDS